MYLYYNIIPEVVLEADPSDKEDLAVDHHYFIYHKARKVKISIGHLINPHAKVSCIRTYHILLGGFRHFSYLHKTEISNFMDIYIYLNH